MLATAHANSGQFDHAWRCIDTAMTAMQATKEGGPRPRPIALPVKSRFKSPQRDEAKAQAHFERALAIARAQHAKSWELRAATSGRGSWWVRANGRWRVTFSRRSTIGVPKDLTQATFVTPRPFYANFASVPDYVPAPA